MVNPTYQAEPVEVYPPLTPWNSSEDSTGRAKGRQSKYKLSSLLCELLPYFFFSLLPFALSLFTSHMQIPLFFHQSASMSSLQKTDFH